jgi:hypothetical protein
MQEVFKRVDGKAAVAAQPSSEEKRTKALQVSLSPHISYYLLGQLSEGLLYCSCNTTIFHKVSFLCDVQALLSCPTSSIHTEKPPKDILQVTPSMHVFHSFLFLIAWCKSSSFCLYTCIKNIRCS